MPDDVGESLRALTWGTDVERQKRRGIRDVGDVDGAVPDVVHGTDVAARAGAGDGRAAGARSADRRLGAARAGNGRDTALQQLSSRAEPRSLSRYPKVLRQRLEPESGGRHARLPARLYWCQVEHPLARAIGQVIDGNSLAVCSHIAFQLFP